jgi:redox-sensing transcriptional repressor
VWTTISSGGLGPRLRGQLGDRAQGSVTPRCIRDPRASGTAVDELVTEVSEVLGLTRERAVVIIGIGNLGRALASLRRLRPPRLPRGRSARRRSEEARGPASGDFDRSSRPTVSRPVGADRRATIAVVATPAEHAQQVVDRLVAAGVTGVLNFAPVHLDCPVSRVGAQGGPVHRAPDPVVLRPARTGPESATERCRPADLRVGPHWPPTTPADAGRLGGRVSLPHATAACPSPPTFDLAEGPCPSSCWA